MSVKTKAVMTEEKDQRSTVAVQEKEDKILNELDLGLKLTKVTANTEDTLTEGNR